MKIFLKLTFILLIVTAGIIYSFLNYIESWSLEKKPHSWESIVELKSGMSAKQLAAQLESKEVITDQHLFWVWVRYYQDYGKFQAGLYRFIGDISPSDIAQKMARGEVYTPISLQVIIPEGFTLKMLVRRMEAKNIGIGKEILKLANSKPFILSLGINSLSLEGYTYPATYNFESSPKPEDFFRRTVKKFFEMLPLDYEENVRKLGLTLDQAVAFASLIELETMHEDEKPLISEVIWSRLKKNDPLGIDAALIYGIPNYDGDIRTKDLKDKKNKYNTRIHKGLPPTAIGSVSRSSLEAVLNPSKLGYYYYVLNSNDPTRHLFSKTLNEHNQNVKIFLKAGPLQLLRSKHEQESKSPQTNSKK